MSGMELNKIMAAVLVAGITASFSAFIAKEVVRAHDLHENAVKVEVASNTTSGGVKKVKTADPILALIAGADLERGKKLSRACASCHSFNKGGANGVGPNLWNLVNRDKASHDGYSYSDSMKEKGGAWKYAELNKFLWKPKKYVSGTKMGYIGMKKTTDRAALIAWLRSLADNKEALPSDADIAAETPALDGTSENESAH